MMQRICPICDQTMTSAHYCRNCRSWIRNPWMREVTYYLNERHPQNEQGCSYHNEGSYGANTDGNPVPGRLSPKPFVTRQAPAQTAARPGVQGSRATAVPNQPRTNGSGASGPAAGRTGTRSTGAGGTRPNVPGLNVSGQNASEPNVLRTGRQSRNTFGLSKIILLVIVIIFVIHILSALILTVKKVVYIYSDNAVEYDVDLGNYVREDAEEFDADADYRELDDSAVISIGKACTGMEHFQVQGPVLEESVCNIMREYGYQVNNADTFSRNEVFGSGESWYQTWLSIELEREQGEGYQYVDLNYDTATGQLHQVEIFLQDPQAAAGTAGKIIELLRECKAFPEDSGWVDEIDRQIAYHFLQKSDFYFWCDGVLIDGYFYDNGCNVYISRETSQQADPAASGVLTE